MSIHIKNAVKAALPAPVLRLLQNGVLHLYAAAERLECRGYLITYKRIFKRNINKARRKIQENKPLKICFLVQFPEMWNSLKSLYEFMLSDSRFDVGIYAVPKKDSTNGGLFRENDVYHFLKNEQVSVFDCKAENTFLPIPSEVDIVFVQRPYDAFMPLEYQLKRLCKDFLICYIPYSGRMTKGQHIETEFNIRLLTFFYTVFADCSESYQFVESWINNNGMAEYKKVYNIGFPRFDLIHTISRNRDTLQKTTQKCKAFLWLPRWAINTNNEESSFLHYIEDFLRFFQEHPDLQLVIRPHPLMFTNFINVGVMTEEGVKTLKERIDQMQNVSFDENRDYLVSFEKCDALISDPTSLLREFYYTGKPVVLSGEYRENSVIIDEARSIFETFYPTTNWEEIRTFIERLAAGKDEKRNSREALFQQFKIDGKNAERIAGQLLTDLMQ